MEEPQENIAIDWSNCPLVEVIPGKVSGVPYWSEPECRPDGIVENYVDGSPIEEIVR